MIINIVIDQQLYLSEKLDNNPEEVESDKIRSNLSSQTVDNKITKGNINIVEGPNSSTTAKAGHNNISDLVLDLLSSDSVHPSATVILPTAFEPPDHSKTIFPPPIRHKSSIVILKPSLQIALQHLAIPRISKPISDLELTFFIQADSQNITQAGYRALFEVLQSLDYGEKNPLSALPTNISTLKRNLCRQIQILLI